MKKQNEKLNTLAILHYVAGGLGCLFSCFPLIHVAVGIFVLNNPEQNPNNPPREFIGYLFAGIGLLFFIMGQIIAGLTIYSGKCIKNQVKHKFSFILSCILCVCIPFGTALGIYSIITLQKEEIKNLYNNA